MHSIPNPALHFPRSCTVDSITRFPRTRIFLPWVRIFFYIISIPSSYYLKYISCPSFLRIFRALYSRNWEKEFLNLLEPNRKSPIELTSTTDISKLRIRCLLESQLRVTPWNKKPMEIVHTQQSRVHHFSLSYGHQATSQLHNSMHPPPCLPARIEDLRHTQPHACTRTHGNR